jgi:hypothetical protein
MLRPNGGFIQIGDDYSGITFLDCEPFTEKEFLDGFAICEKNKINLEKKRIADREALLTKLGITAEEAALLLS